MSGTSGFKGSGITDPFLTPDAPTVDSVSAGVLSASVSFTAPTDTGGGAITQYVASAKQSDGSSVFGTGTSSPIDITLTAGGTTEFAVQAFNTYGAGQFSGYGNSTSVFTGAEAYSLGANNQGQLGHNDLVYRSSPTQVGALTDWSVLDTGRLLSGGVKTDGTLWTWGLNSGGQLGHNDVIRRSSPVQVGVLTNWLAVSTGDDYSLAVKTDGTLWGWGRNAGGRVGDSSTTNRSSPVQIGSDTDWSAKIVAGLEGTSGAIKTTGELYLWGENGTGLIGDNSQTDRNSPVQIGLDPDWLDFSVGASTTAAVKTDGSLWNWGGTNLAIGTAGYRSSPVQVGALTNWSSVGVARDEAGASIKTDGTLWTWGGGSIGTLGRNDTVSASSPVQVGSDTNWSKIVGGQLFFIAIRTDSTLWAWGDNDNGQLGLENRTNKSSPTQIGVENGWFSIGAGLNETAALKGVTS